MGLLDGIVYRGWVFTKATTRDIGALLYDWLKDRVREAWVRLLHAFAQHNASPEMQMLASILWIIAAIGFTFLTGGALVGVVAVFVFTFLWGFARLAYQFGMFVFLGEGSAD